MTPRLFRQAITSAIVTAVVGLIFYMLIKLIAGENPIIGDSVWTEMVPILFIGGFLGRLFSEERKPR